MRCSATVCVSTFTRRSKPSSELPSAGRPLPHLALRWPLRQPGVTSVLVSAKTFDQVRANAQALEGDIPGVVFDELTALSDQVIAHIPDEGNPFGYHP
ncbi:MAG: aldo/keto reductase [Anaerolineae bacterium]